MVLAKDVANWIEHNQVTRMIELVDEDEKLKCLLSTSGQRREMWFLTEDGLYEVLMQSRKPIAKAFKKEVNKNIKRFETGVDLLDLKGNSDFEMEILHNGLYTQNPNEMVSRVDEDEKVKVNNVYVEGRNGGNGVWLLTEDGLTKF